MVIRWLGLYGPFYGEVSLDWELTQKAREVSAEWTVKGRPFIFGGHTPEIGLLVKTKAVVKRIRKDAYTTWPDRCLAKWRRQRKTLVKSKLSTHLWEAICYPDYAGIIVVQYVTGAYHMQLATDAANKYRLPLLMLQEDRKILKPVSPRMG